MARWIVRFAAVGVLALGEGPAVVAGQSATGALFRDAPVLGVPDTQVGRANPAQLRARLVFINHDALPNPAAGAQETSRGGSLTLNLFDDASFTAVLDRLETRPGGLTWAGHIPGIDLSTVTLVTEGEVMAGSIVTPEAAYSIRYAGDGRHFIAQVDQSQYPPELAPLEPRVLPVQPGMQDQRSVAAQSDTAATIDVMVLYTSAAATEAGGTSAINTRINLGISETNTSYGNSGITQRLRLVHSEQVVHTDNDDLAQDLYSLSNYNGTQLSTSLGDAAAALRNTYAADLVMLVTAPASPNGCGIAWLMTSVNAGFAPYGFSVVDQSCISPNYTFAHELGHNMGARHDWYIDNGITPYTYSHGYVYTTNRWRTVMAYNDLCSVQSFNCNRLLYWSNPGVTNSGIPMGIAGGTKSDCPKSNTSNTACDADDHRTLDNTALTVANFRSSLACSFSVSPTSAAAGVPTSSSTVSVTTTAGCNWTATSNVSWITITGGASGTASAQVSYSVATNTGRPRTGTMTIAGQTVTVSQSSSLPTLAATPGTLRFGAVNSGGTLTSQTPSQVVTIAQSGSGTVGWAATANVSWLTITGGSGTGAGSFTVTLNNTGAALPASGSLSGMITIGAPSSQSDPTVPTFVAAYAPGGSTAPFGAFDTPAGGPTVLQGSFAVTGWALDDVGIDRVEIWRDAVAGETTPTYVGPGHPGHGKIFIANPLFINGSRPDVEAAYSTSPFAYRSGWGYLLLSWGLWAQGNGSYTIYAFAFDRDGRNTTLGTKTITVSNATATRPFGALDTPSYGATVSGAFWNYGWALTPRVTPSCTITNGNVLMSIDSGPLVPVTYGDPRTDISAAFPGFTNTTNAGGAFYLNTTTLTNGTHQIGWLVYDSCGRGDGIGSRFFTVLNGSSNEGAQRVILPASRVVR